MDEKVAENNASETEEQRKERLNIRREKIEQEGEPKNYKRERKGRQKEKTTRNSAWPLKRLKRGDKNELKRNLRLEKVVASKQKSKTGE